MSSLSDTLYLLIESKKFLSSKSTVYISRDIVPLKVQYHENFEFDFTRYYYVCLSLTTRAVKRLRESASKIIFIKQIDL